MFTIYNAAEEFTLYELKEDGIFHIRKHFENKQDLIRYFVHSDFLGWNSILAILQKKPTKVLEQINLTGFDTYIQRDYLTGAKTTYLRPYLLMDGLGRIIDPKMFSKEIQTELVKVQNEKRHYMYVHSQSFRYRIDPVPRTGVRHGKYYRSMQNWAHNYRLDHNPEHEEFIRKKARIPDPWEFDPWEPCYRSWKHNTKHRHQWEK